MSALDRKDPTPVIAVLLFAVLVVNLWAMQSTMRSIEAVYLSGQEAGAYEQALHRCWQGTEQQYQFQVRPFEALSRAGPYEWEETP